MRIIRFVDENGQAVYGVQQGEGKAARIAGDIFGDFTVAPDIVAVTKLLAPIVPTVVLCIGLNYRRHAEESNLPIPKFPVLFFKSPGSVQNPGDAIEIPKHLKSEKVDYEAELVVVIGRRCKNVSVDEALGCVFGYTCGNDVSARDWQVEYGGSQWCRGKTFDTFMPLGPAIVTKDEIANPNSLRIATTLNGEVMQDWNTNDMIFGVAELISFLSGSTTLLPGTIIMTGTPHGVGQSRKPPRFLAAGDSVTVSIESIGDLTSPVVEEA